VVCEESWEKIDEQARTVTETSRHAWLSSQPLSQDNVHERCNLGARHRWGIEAGFSSKNIRATTTSMPLPSTGMP
jgi:hypothetical protein